MGVLDISGTKKYKIRQNIYNRRSIGGGGGGAAAVCYCVIMVYSLK